MNQFGLDLTMSFSGNLDNTPRSIHPKLAIVESLNLG